MRERAARGATESLTDEGIMLLPAPSSGDLH
jgi:hypothetical protein